MTESIGKVERDELCQWDRQHLWHPFTQMAEYAPLVITHAEGNILVDIDGNELIDAVSSLWCNIHGHRHPLLDRAIRDQLDRVAHTTQLGASHPVGIRLAKRLVEVTPAGLNHVFFSDDGATAVEVALKMAFQYWRQRPDPRPEKTLYVNFANAYHGDTIGSVSVGGVERFHEMFRPLLFETLTLPTPDTYRLPDGVSPDQACGYYAAALERILARQHRKIAAVVMEPLIQAAAGMIAHPAGFLRRVRELTQKYEVLLIADEVAVGFGRTGTMFACEHEQVSPDFLCLAKGLTGGYLPLAATLTTTDIWNAFLGNYTDSKTFFHGHTYAGNPLGSAVALANLDLFENERTLDGLQPKIACLADQFKRLRTLPYVGDVRQKGLIGAVELVADVTTKKPFDWSEKRGIRVCERAREKGVLLRPLGNVIVIMPPLSIKLEQLDQICTAAEHGIRQVLRGLP